MNKRIIAPWISRNPWGVFSRILEISSLALLTLNGEAVGVKRNKSNAKTRQRWIIRNCDSLRFCRRFREC